MVTPPDATGRRFGDLGFWHPRQAEGPSSGSRHHTWRFVVPAFPALTHVAVTVTDLERSTQWYTQLFDSEPVLDEDETTGGFHHTVYLIGGGQLFGLHTHPQATGDKFSEYQTGLDHVSFGCADRDELARWADRLDQLGITHGGIVDAHYGSGVSFRDPDGIALEFFAPPAA
jgi:glyoxylase I family protein